MFTAGESVNCSPIGQLKLVADGEVHHRQSTVGEFLIINVISTNAPYLQIGSMQYAYPKSKSDIFLQGFSEANGQMV